MLGDLIEEYLTARERVHKLQATSHFLWKTPDAFAVAVRQLDFARDRLNAYPGVATGTKPSDRLVDPKSFDVV